MVRKYFKGGKRTFGGEGGEQKCNKINNTSENFRGNKITARGDLPPGPP